MDDSEVRREWRNGAFRRTDHSDVNFAVNDSHTSENQPSRSIPFGEKPKPGEETQDWKITILLNYSVRTVAESKVSYTEMKAGE
jgi:hypothetical protein